jgi:hypothetical protein
MGDEDRSLPTNDLDLNLMLTNSVWGSTEVNQDLKDKLNKSSTETDKNGKVIVTKSSLWGLLGFFTRDMRLGNLSDFNNELIVCRYHIDLANDLLSVDMNEPFLISLSRSANILETSQSKGGFLRRIMNTLRHENVNENREPPKKGFFGGKSNNESGGY